MGSGGNLARMLIKHGPRVLELFEGFPRLRGLRSVGLLQGCGGGLDTGQDCGT